MLSLSRLPWMNLRGYPVRTGTLIFFSMLMTMTIFGGTLVVQGIEHGLRTTQSRLGADIMVTPADADTDFDAQTFLVNAEPSYFYMDAGTREAVRSARRRCRGRMRRNQAATPTPSTWKTSAIQPCHDRSEVCTRALPMEQPPAQAAPIPMRTPPAMERWMTWALGTRTRNSPEALAAR